MTITATLVKELRERTGAGMMDCKRALVEEGGDLEKAAELLRKAGQAKADKKSSRVAAEGLVLIKGQSSEGRHIILEVNSETDFVAKDENFSQFAELVAQTALAKSSVSDIEELMTLEVEGETLEGLRLELVTKIGENISVRRFEILDSDGLVGAYTHMGRIGVLVELDGGTVDIARDMAMQIAATAPEYVSADDVPQEELAKEREILVAQAMGEGKPPEIVEKMVEGRLRKHLDEMTLLGQPFVKDSDQKIRDLLIENKATVKRFLRYEVGEGIEKRKDDFVQEVMAQASQSG
ncbi:MAG: elongation factor Ts [Rhodospirillaceae bacterium]|nr:elongation factor Ts [Rhodospirillaceae bacterium]